MMQMPREIPPFQAVRVASLFHVAAPGSTLRLAGVCELADGTFRAAQLSARSLFLEAVDSRVLPAHEHADAESLRAALAIALTRDGFTVATTRAPVLPLGILEPPPPARESQLRRYEALLDFSRIDAAIVLRGDRRMIRLAIAPSRDDQHACIVEVAEYAGRSRTRFAQALRSEDSSDALRAAVESALRSGMALVNAREPA